MLILLSLAFIYICSSRHALQLDQGRQQALSAAMDIHKPNLALTLKNYDYLPSLSKPHHLFFTYLEQTWHSTNARDKDIEHGFNTGYFATLKKYVNTVMDGIIYESWSIINLKEVNLLMSSQLEMLLQAYFSIQNMPNHVLSGIINTHVMPSEIYRIAQAYFIGPGKSKTIVNAHLPHHIKNTNSSQYCPLKICEWRQYQLSTLSLSSTIFSWRSGHFCKRFTSAGRCCPQLSIQRLQWHPL